MRVSLYFNRVSTAFVRPGSGNTGPHGLFSRPLASLALRKHPVVTPVTNSGRKKVE